MNNTQRKVLDAAVKKRQAQKKQGDYVGFDALKEKLSHRPGVKNPGALAAYIGRKTYGKAGFQALGRTGR